MKKFGNKILIMALCVLLAASTSACFLFLPNDTTYDVENNYFTYHTFSTARLNDVNLETGQTSYDFVIEITSSCAVSLTEFTADVKLYSADDTLLYEKVVSETRDVHANEEFSFYVSVAYDVQQATRKVAVTYSGKSKDNPSGNASSYNVTFVYNNGKSDRIVTVKTGNRVNEPSAPTKPNCTFDAWYTSTKYTQKYDFSTPVKDNLTLYAKYVVDYAALTNQITATTMKANVTVITKSYNTVLGITSSYSTKTGSGIIYQLANGKYYLLTNNHVTVKESSYSNVEYTIEDYKGNTYKGTLISQNAGYDLAALYFTKSETLQVIPLATSNPLEGTELVSIGQPKSQSNALTYGTLSDYDTVTLKNTTAAQSNVTFRVIQHTCPINSGSSGGALLDTNLTLVGINYACATSASGEFVAGYAIPIEKVREFLRMYADYNG